MMKLIRLERLHLAGLAVLLCLPVLVAACQPNQEQAGSEDMALKLSLTSQKRRYKLNETIYVTVTLHNEGATSLTVNGRLLLNRASAPQEVRDLYLEITGPAGYMNHNVFQVNAGKPAERDLVKLEAGGTHQRRLELTRFESLHLPGQYTIIAHYLNVTPVAGFEVWQGSLQSEPLVLERR